MYVIFVVFTIFDVRGAGIVADRFRALQVVYSHTRAPFCLHSRRTLIVFFVSFIFIGVFLFTLVLIRAVDLGSAVNFVGESVLIGCIRRNALFSFVGLLLDGLVLSAYKLHPHEAEDANHEWKNEQFLIRSRIIDSQKRKIFPAEYPTHIVAV